MDSDSPYAYENLVSLPIREKVTLLDRNDKIFHIIFAEQFGRELLETLCRLATKTRKIAKSMDGMCFLRSLLRHKSAMLYFTQPSTRTFLSFVRACQHLGIVYAEVRDPRISSHLKGETDIDGIRTFSSYFDLIIMRHEESGLAERIAYMMNDINRSIPVISGGAGQDQHPTQALLDVYTLIRSFEWRKTGIDGIQVAFVGDNKRGRTVRSLAKLLTRFENVKMTFVSPEEFRIKDDLRDMLQSRGVNFSETDDVRDVLQEADAVYMTRVQDEYDESGESGRIDYSKCRLTLEKVRYMKERAIIMHPLPRRDELDPRIDSDPRAMYWRQERNGMWMRAALMAYLFNVESKIIEYYANNYRY
jgi:aspartate carbamoyltransferase catalytic subunit